MAGNHAFLAAIEIGSHEVMLKIAEVFEGGKIQNIETASRTINLGSDSYRLGYITPENIHLLISTVEDFIKKIEMYPDAVISAVCTSAIREAENRIFIIDQIFRETGLEVQILSNREEMAGMNLAVRYTMPEFDELTGEPTLLLDIGAGSTQLTLFDEQQFLFTQNILLGSLRVRDRLAVLEQHTADFQALMQEYISGDLDYYRSFVPKKTDYKHFVLIGNLLSTWRYLAGLDLRGTVALHIDVFERLFQEITNSSTLSLIEKYSITEEQSSILLPMSMVIKEVFELTKLDQVLLPDATLADGLNVSQAKMLGFIAEDDKTMQDAISFAKEIARRHHTDRRHIRQVENLAMQLFDQLQSEHGLSQRERHLLKIACILHNIGKFFTVKQDGDVAYQLVKSADLAGLSNQEIELIALLVKYHSVNTENLITADLHISDENHLILIKLSVLLALANALDTGHQVKVKRIRCEIRKKHIKLYLESNQELTLETWSIQNPAKDFREVFGKELRIIVLPYSEKNNRS